MAILSWLKQTIPSALKAGQAFGRNILTPALDWAKQIPGVGGIIEAAQPLIDTAGKAYNYATGLATGDPEEIAKNKLTMEDFGKAVGGVVGAGKALMGLGGGDLGTGAFSALNTLKRTANTELDKGIKMLAKRPKLMGMM